MSGPLLVAEGLTKEFPGVRALDGVSFDVRPGEVHALCGENGAGKSTLIKTLSGIHPHGSYGGRILCDGREVRFGSPADAEAAGIGVIYQELALVDDLTVAENIALGREPTRAGGLIDWGRLHHDAAAALGRFGIAIDPTARCGDLGTGAQQLVEIAKALTRNSRVLILDEPTAALTESEVQVLLRIVRDLRSQGVGLVYISHRLDEVFALADRITVLRDGRSVATRDAAGVGRDELIKLMVGREIADLFPRRATAPGEPLLTVDGLATRDPAGRPFHADVGFTVHAGEVLGIGGLMGSGRSELLLHLIGAWGTRTAGTVRLRGEPVTGGPRGALAAGIALVSEDRKRLGLHIDHPITRNLSLSSLGAISRGLIDRSAEARRNRDMADRLRVKAAHLDVVVGTLSGGNQQKIAIGKALLADPRVVLLDEPTRGIDVGAKIEVYEVINRLTAEGRAVIMVSSELPELIGMSDRILMIAGGRVGGSFTRAEATPERLLAAAIPENQVTP